MERDLPGGIGELETQFDEDAAPRWGDDAGARRTSSKRFSATIGEHEDETVAIVAHGGPVRRLVALLLNLSLDSYWRIRVDNAALTVFESGTSGYVMTALNDVCHLEEHLR